LIQQYDHHRIETKLPNLKQQKSPGLEYYNHHHRAAFPLETLSASASGLKLQSGKKTMADG
jgi:hypothetical protein